MKDKCKLECQVKKMKQGFEEEDLLQIKGQVRTATRDEGPEWKDRRSSTTG